MGWPTDNLSSLHTHEQRLRDDSLAAIGKRDDLSDHWAIVAADMDVIHAYLSGHPHESEDELTLQLFAIRLFNSAAASIKLALSGYYQQAIHQIRDIVETSFLIDYLQTFPEKIDAWRKADKKARMADFGPAKIRAALDKRDGYTGEKRKQAYDRLSEAASHASQRGFSLTTNANNLAEIVPFFDERKLAAWLQELATHFTLAAQIVSMSPEGRNTKLAMARLHYMSAVAAWQEKYFARRGGR